MIDMAKLINTLIAKDIKIVSWAHRNEHSDSDLKELYDE